MILRSKKLNVRMKVKNLNGRSKVEAYPKKLTTSVFF